MQITALLLIYSPPTGLALSIGNSILLLSSTFGHSGEGIAAFGSAAVDVSAFLSGQQSTHLNSI